MFQALEEKHKSLSLKSFGVYYRAIPSLVALVRRSAASVWFGFLGALMSGPLFAAEINETGLRESVVTINAYSGREVVASGSGYVVQSDRFNGYVIAGAGLVSGRSTLTVVTPGGQELVAQVLEIEAALEIALLKVNGLDLPPLLFSRDQPQIGDVVWSVVKWSPLDESLGLSKGNLINASNVPSTQAGQLSHSGIVGDGSVASILLNECGEIIGLNRPVSGPGTNVRAVDAGGIRSMLSAQNIRALTATTPCLSIVGQAREQAAVASAQAIRATEEAVRAQDAAKELEKLLQASNQRNEALVAQARAARERADEAIAAAELARQNAVETRIELERRTASLKAETDALISFIERDRLAAERRFNETLALQRAESALRERWLMGTGIVLLLVGMTILYFLRVRSPEPRQVVSAGIAPAAGRDISRSKTEMHNQDLVEYVLDGRDEDGIRYLLRISGDQLVSPDGVVIGRNPKDSPYIINHADVSRKHARMKVMKNRVFIEDLGSTNGTSVNGQSIDDKGPVSVNSGDQIIIGSVVMKLRVLGG